MATVGIPTMINEGVVKVKFGLAGIIQGHKFSQDYLHNHRFQSWWSSSVGHDSLCLMNVLIDLSDVQNEA